MCKKTIYNLLAGIMLCLAIVLGAAGLLALPFLAGFAYCLQKADVLKWEEEIMKED